MKKILAGLLICASFLSLASCGEQEQNADGTTLATAVNGTYDAYGCTDPYHGDYAIESLDGVTIMYGNTQISASELEKGDVIAVHYSGISAVTHPAYPQGVTKIEIWDGDPSKQSADGTCKLFTVTCLADGKIHMNEYKEEFSFTAMVLEVSDGRILVDASGSGNGYYYKTNYKYWLVIGEQTTLCYRDEAISLDEIEAGDYIFVKYDGKIEELYPAILPNVISVTLFDLAHTT